MNFTSKDNFCTTAKKWNFFLYLYKYEAHLLSYNFFNFVFSKCAYCTLWGYASECYVIFSEVDNFAW